MTSRAREIIVADDSEALARIAAQHLLHRIAQQPQRVAICLTGGSGPSRLYQLLAGEFAASIPWPRVHWFIGDERFVPPDDPLSNMGVARRAFLDGRAPPGHIHPMPTDAATPDAVARRYQDELQNFYGAAQLAPARPLFDLTLMGIGPDGHTASLFPDAPALAETSRWVVGVEHAAVPPLVPRVTLTLPALAASRELLFLAGGAAKREIITRLRAGADLPAARARAVDGDTVWLIDRAAAGTARDA